MIEPSAIVPTTATRDAATSDAPFIPRNESDLRIALEAYLLDKAVYEIGYELNHRPDWVVIPIRGIKHILKSS